MQKKLYIVDERMLKLRDLLKDTGKIRFYQEFYDAIEIKKQAISYIQIGRQHFTVRQIEMACKNYGADAKIKAPSF